MTSVPLRRPRGESRAVDDTYLGEGDLGSGHSVTLPLQHRALVPPSPSTPKLSVAVFLLVFYAFSLGQRLKVGNVDGKRYAFDENAAASSALDLVIVAGHAVLNFKSDLLHAGRDDSCWQLLPYQMKKGMPEAILGHIRSGIASASENRDALLIFSGGETRRDVGPISEGASYFAISDAMFLWAEEAKFLEVRSRTATEEFATDSFQNLLFSICRFHEITGRFPRHISLVSFSFKRQRFEDMHAHALRWPSDRFTYISIDPEAREFDLKLATRGESENALKPFQTDMYGCHSKVLTEKREKRNPFRRTSGYDSTCSDILPLLNHCGPELFEGDLPWDGDEAKSY
ncbi:hypothetical protein TrST_g14281 [Triparma strigata]|uniref:DUF218 domain-containing protein n=1 Tax=Triparma strigata TaxID=1606541 RepID=A0A9W7F5L5_9STRA|nr:hypothetical protein TrST_g14281 [Triparma strigata]